jgi:hypothetical protein
MGKKLVKTPALELQRELYPEFLLKLAPVKTVFARYLALVIDG